MTFTKAQAIKALPTVHERILDAALIHIDSALSRYTGSHVDVPIAPLIPPGETTEKQKEEFVQKLMDVKTTDGWHPIETTVDGVPVLRFS